YKGFPGTVDMELGLVTFMHNFDVSEWVIRLKSVPSKMNNYDLIERAIADKGFDSRSNTLEIERLYDLLVRG
ncbi:hypothetical protein N9439_00160, partial [Schleiferiaceae bacterium]|nr:hypothetical protein [Schleiferiaceae bacterium]